MNLKYPLLICAIFLFLNCKGQKKHTNDLYFKDFGWTIKIPESFTPYQKEKWKNVQNRGAKILGSGLHSNLETIFIYKIGNNSFFEATTEPHLKSKEEYYAGLQLAYDAFYNAMVSNSPTAHVDTVKTIERIGEVDFYKFGLSSDKSVLHTISFSSLYGTNQLTISIMYDNDDAGQLILKTFKASTFKKEKK